MHQNFTVIYYTEIMKYINYQRQLRNTFNIICEFKASVTKGPPRTIAYLSYKHYKYTVLPLRS